MRRAAIATIASVLLVLAPAQPTLALSCPAGKVVWIQAYNSPDGTYKQVAWQGGSQYFPGTGTHYISTHRQANAFVNITSNSSSTSKSEFCVPAGVDLP